MKKKLSISLLLIILLLALLNCKGRAKMTEPGIYATMNTNKGTMVFKLYYKIIPVAVANFVGLAEGQIQFTDPKTEEQVKRPYFDGITFHRIIAKFMIQGGDPLGNGTGGPGYNFFDEIDPTLKFDSVGVLSMANSGPNSNGSQFFVTVAPQPHLDGKYVIFGHIISGEDVLLNISKVKTNDQNKPFDPVYIKSVKIERVGDDAKNFDAAKTFANRDVYLQKRKNALLTELGVKDLSKIQTVKETGLQYYLLKPGSGQQPKKGDLIFCNYAGYFENGVKFDSSYDRHQTFKTAIGVHKVIEGWDQAFLGMKEGEERVLIIPYYLAYGERGYPGQIPPYATLIFKVELLNVERE